MTDPDKNAKFYIDRANFFVFRDVKASRFTRSKPIKEIILGFNQEYDLSSAKRKIAEDMYNTEREKAIREKITDEMGVPLDNEARMPWGDSNPNYGQPLEPRYIRQSVGIGRLADGTGLKLSVNTHNGAQALIPIPTGKGIELTGTIKSSDDLRQMINISSQAKYEDTVFEEFPGGVDASTVCELLAGAPDEYKSDLAGLEAWHKAHEGDRQRFVILEVDAMYIATEPMSTGNWLMIVQDESVMDVEAEGTTVFIHPQIAYMVDFANFSKIYVIGRTQMGNAYNRETKKADPTKKRVLINAFGVWAIPEYKIPREEGPLEALPDS
jgi:hypothetical protein